MFEFKAHDKACSSLSFSPHIPNMMATCSVDEYVKVWDIANNNGTEPKLISHKKMTMGELFTLSFYKDIPWVLAAGGSKGEVAVWDTEESEAIAKHFSIDKTLASEVMIEESDEELDDEEESEEKEEAKKPSKKSSSTGGAIQSTKKDSKKNQMK